MKKLITEAKSRIKKIETSKVGMQKFRQLEDKMFSSGFPNPRLKGSGNNAQVVFDTEFDSDDLDDDGDIITVVERLADSIAKDYRIKKSPHLNNYMVMFAGGITLHIVTEGTGRPGLNKGSAHYSDS